ncbi:hypothetical protein MW887_000866 [Aspergillus wentii]|nr:hypothetical protein MW887_000866 [Aspergillus wentii]
MASKQILYDQFFETPPYPTASFTDKTVIVTGSNVGLGFEAVRHFLRLDAAKVILAVRNVAAGTEAKNTLEESTGRQGRCEVWELDLASFDSVKKFAARAATLPRLDVVVENAGIATDKYSTAEGHERTITVNVISTILLALLLLPKLKETAKQTPLSPPRLSIVTSEVHAFSNLPEWKTENTFATLDDEKTAIMGSRYHVSKLLEVLVVREIAPKLADSGVILNMLNPGFCHSSLQRDLEGGWLFNTTLRFIKGIVARTTEVGSRCLVASAAAGPETHGAYMSNGREANAMLSPFVRSEEGKKAQKKVWKELSEILENIEPGITSF